MSLSDEIKKKMDVALEHFKTELKNIRTGRANPGLVEHIMVEAYGSSVRLKDIASISTPDSRQILITPFDPQMASTIGKAIEKGNLGFMPAVDANAVRLRIPPMTEELRKKMGKLCHDEKEKAKISIRNIRREANDLIRKKKSDGHMSEDEVKKIEKTIQEATDKYCKEADELAIKKEKEIETI
jgi:ribosome recycling factor